MPPVSGGRANPDHPVSEDTEIQPSFLTYPAVDVPLYPSTQRRGTRSALSLHVQHAAFPDDPVQLSLAKHLRTGEAQTVSPPSATVYPGPGITNTFLTPPKWMS